MTHLLASLLGPNGAAGVPAIGSPSGVHNAGFSAGQSPFHALLSQHLQLLQQTQQPGMTPGSLPVMGAFSPWQSVAAGGQSFPLSPAGIMPSSGITIESVMYSRISMNGNGMLNTVYGGPNQDPQNALAELLTKIDEQPAGGLPVGGDVEAVAAQTENETPDAEAANRLASSSEDLTNPEYLGEKIGKAVANISNAQVPNAEFAIDHPKYGRIEARVDITNDGVDLAFGVQDPELRAALEAARADIELALQGKGLSLAKLDVGPPQDLPQGAIPGTGEDLVSAYTSQRDAALSRIIGDLALGLRDNPA